VSDTAFWVAHHRAAETARPDALFRDPLAAVLAGERGKAIASAMPWARMTGWVMAIRTYVIDDYIGRAIAQGIDTVLNLGAGLDTRPYRMDLPERLVWIEADLAPMIALKESRLAGETPRCRLERVKIDLADADARRRLLDGVNRRAGRVLVLTEGVIPYLGEEEVRALADELRAMDCVRSWIVEYIPPEAGKVSERRRTRRTMRNAPFKFTPKDWFAFFGERGWRVEDIRYLVEVSRQLSRPIPLPRVAKLVLGVRRLLFWRKGRDRLTRSIAYALLEPTPRL
jgi:methyltransferase (TIGR00027 family)